MIVGYFASQSALAAGLVIAMAAGFHLPDESTKSDPHLPMFDISADREHIITNFVEIEPDERIDGTPYFDASIPRKVHQIWFGDPGKLCHEPVARWRQFAKKFKYKYQLWTERDDDLLAALMPKENFDLMVRLRAAGSYRSASDMVRMSLLEREGGVYSDVDIGPPMHNHDFVDLSQIIPMRGLVILNENFARNVGNSAVFFGNNFIASSAGQPLIRHMVHQMPINLRHRLPEVSQQHKPLPKDEKQEAHHTGPFLLNRSLAGVATVLPITFARRLDMVRDQKWDIEKRDTPSFDELSGEKEWECHSVLHEVGQKPPL